MQDYTDAELAQILDKDIFHLISEAADRLGMECYVVGGYVRDIFLERPSDDIDCVVVGSGISVAKELKRMLGRRAHLSVFKNFGTAQVKCYLNDNDNPSANSGQAADDDHNQERRSIEVEFVGARKESYQRDSRKPIVEDGTLEDDQNRRDFTINAMAICLNKGRFGELVDPFGGLDDLWDGIIRTPLDPDITFSDDPLRMLRCIRFATRLNFKIEDETFDALQRNAERIKIISGERIQEELNKILMTKTPSRGFVDLQMCGLLQLILPELSIMDMVETRNGRAHKNNFYHTLEVLDNVCKDNGNGEAALWLRWAALLHDIGKPRSKRWDNSLGWTFHAHNIIGAKMVPGIFRKLKLPMDMKMKFVQKMVELHMRPIAIADDIVTDSAVRRLVNDAGDDIDDLMRLCEADITSKNQQRKQQFRDNYQLVRQKIDDLKVKDFKRLLQPVIDGNEIMEMFNLTPSREVGELKKVLKDAVLDNRVENEREPLMLLLKETAKKMGLTMVVMVVMALGLISCESDRTKAESLLNEIETDMGHEQYEAALLKIDSLRRTYPMEVKVRKEALKLHQEASLKIAQATLADIDRELQMVEGRYDSLSAIVGKHRNELQATAEELQTLNELRAYKDSLKVQFDVECARIKYIHKRQNE